MSGLYVCDLRVGEEGLDGGHGVIRDVPRPRTSDEQRGPMILFPLRFREREISHIIERVPDDRQRYAEFEDIVFRSDKIGQKKLTDWKRLDFPD